MASSGGVEVEGTRNVQILVIHANGAAALLHRLSIVAAQDINVRCYMLYVASVRREAAQHVRGAQSPFRKRRHLHRMDIHVQNSGMPGPGIFEFPDRRLQNGDRLPGQGVRVRFPGLEVPQFPGCAGDGRLSKESGDIQVPRECGINHPHLIGKLPVPSVQCSMVVLVAGTVADRDRLYKRMLVRPVVIRPVQCAARFDCSVMALGQRFGNFPLGVADPGTVVERAAGIGDAPPGHRAIGIVFDRLAKAGYGFFVVVGVGPVQTQIEPRLRLRRLGRDVSLPSTEIEFIVRGIFRVTGAR